MAKRYRNFNELLAKMKPKQRARITPGSGNIFADLDLPNPEERLAKSDLAIHISRVIATRKLTQEEAGSILGIDQTRVSHLVNGKLSEFSFANLIRLVKRLGYDVEIQVRIKPSRKR